MSDLSFQYVLNNGGSGFGRLRKVFRPIGTRPPVVS
jgi:hypothetical protein